jgi:hypothetical protein
VIGSLGMPTLGVLAFLVVLVVAGSCWVLISEDRTERASRLEHQWI